jgi:Protein of unknown function (DUF3800)
VYLLFLDESGTHEDSPVSIVAGIAVHEQDAWRLQNRLSAVLERGLPKHLDALDFELHAAEIKSPYSRKRKPSPWESIPYPKRMAILDAAYRSLTSYQPADPTLPLVLFGAVVDADYADKVERGYEEVLHKFYEMLTRQAHEQGRQHERGLALHDEAVVEGDLQAWTSKWRHTAGRIGVLTHLADVPVFADSKASRLIQAADLVAWALWRYYGLAQANDYWVRRFWPKFDNDRGVMHGLIRVTREFKAGRCECPPCASRKPAVILEAEQNEAGLLLAPRPVEESEP